MSSVPVQFLIYVLPIPQCPTPPEFITSLDCLEVQVGVTMTFTVYAMNQCDPDISTVTDIIVSKTISGVTAGTVTQASDDSYASLTLTWTPQANQLGSQTLCVLAYTR